jgi:hypothetical protein
MVVANAKMGVMTTGNIKSVIPSLPWAAPAGDG